MKRGCEWFLLIAGFLFTITAAAKIGSVFQGGHVLSEPAPLIGWVSNGELLVAVAIAELVVASFIVIGQGRYAKLVSVVWLVTVFAVYRIGLVWIGYEGSCNCLGTVAGAVHLVKEGIVHGVLDVAFYGLLAGGYAFLIWEWVKRRHRSNVSNVWTWK